MLRLVPVTIFIKGQRIPWLRYIMRRGENKTVIAELE